MAAVGYEQMSLRGLDEELDVEISNGSTKGLLQDGSSVRTSRVVTGFVFTFPSTLGGCLKMLCNLGDGDEDGEEEDNGKKEARVAEIHHEIQELEDRVRDLEMRKDRIKSKYEELLEGVDDEIKEKNKEMENLAHEQQELQKVHEPHHDVTALPGPSSLKWVEGSVFSTISNIIIVVNIVVLFTEIGNKAAARKYLYLDHGFMIFYCVELWLKLILWREMFLIGKLSVVWWHWLDLTIVVTGVLEMWIYPALITTGIVHKHGDTTWLRLLRLGRLARIVKIISAILRQNLDWVEGPKFQLFIQGVIMVNSLVIALECDIPSFAGWIYVEQVMLAVFSFEVAARLKHWGFCLFFVKNVDDLVWNWLDFIIVFGGIIDQWMMPGIELVQIMLGMEPMQPSKLGNVMMLLRLARLLRILRLVRLIHSIPPLYQLIISIALALKGMLWVLVLSFIILYIFALLAVRLVSHGLVFGGTAPEEVAEIFPNVPQSIFVLFQVMNGDTDMLAPLFVALPSSQMFFMVFTVLSSWAILSILTAVISEKMMKAALDYETDQDEKDRDKHAEHTQKQLEKFFDEFDKDKDGKLCLEEWKEMMTQPDKIQRLTDATGLSDEDIKDLFSFLSRADNVDRNGNPVIKVDRQAFINGCKTLKENVTEASIMRLEKQLWEVRKSIRDKIDQNALHKQSFDIQYDDKWTERMREGLENLSIQFENDMPRLDDDGIFVDEVSDSHGKCLYRRRGQALEKNFLFKGGFAVENCEDEHSCNGFYMADGTYKGKPRYKNIHGAFILYDDGWKIMKDSFADPSFIKLDDKGKPVAESDHPPSGHWQKYGQEEANPDPIICRVYEAGNENSLPDKKDFPLTFTVLRKKGPKLNGSSLDGDSSRLVTRSSWFWYTDRSA